MDGRLLQARFGRRRLVMLAAASAALTANSFSTAASAQRREITFPGDDGVHPDALTEWWYYTGHLRTEDDRRFGFEEVFFRARRGTLQGWAAHVAITDAGAMEFVYDQRRVLGNDSVQQSAEGIDFALDDWVMSERDDGVHLAGAVAGYAFALVAKKGKPPVLHGDHGFTFGSNGAGSAYYSRTRCPLEGHLFVGGVSEPVTGEAWMDHQWGDFTSFSEGGWDWFAIQLDDETELMAYFVRDAQGLALLAVATFVESDGSYEQVKSGDLAIEPCGSWRSAESGAAYPSCWRLELTSRELSLTLEPVLASQELDTRETTGITYWEGDVSVRGTRGSRPIAGDAYVELTGYARERDGAAP